MKVRIKTDHGYVSFQPDGRLEYRQAAGPWEEIDIEGLELRQPERGAPPPVSAPPLIVEGPPPAEDAGYVRAIKAQLELEGVTLTGPCGAFAITKRVAWGLRANGAGLLSKPGGNNCEGFATDIVLFRDGQAFDILHDGGNTNGPLWNPTEVDDPRGRWRAPVQP